MNGTTAFWATPPNHVSQPPSMNQARNLGMTSAISMAGPKPVDIQKTKELDEALRPHGVSESDEELNHRWDALLHESELSIISFFLVFRMEVLRKINELAKQWIRDVSVLKNMPVSSADNVGGKIYTFGSYRLVDIRVLNTFTARFQMHRWKCFNVLCCQVGCSQQGCRY